MRARLLFALALAACENGGGGSAIDVQLVDTAGENAAAGLDGTLEIVVRQNDHLLACDDGACVSMIDNGEFELPFPLESFEAMTWAQATITHPTGRLIGAAPPFQPAFDSVDVLGFVRIVMAPAPSCRVLTVEGAVHGETPHLSPARAHAGAVLRRNLVLFAGGDPGDAVDRIDLLTNEGNPLPSWAELEPPPAIGPARAVAISENVSLVVGDTRSWAFFLSDTLLGARPEDLGMIHPGAGSSSAVLATDTGAVVISGRMSSDITWLGPEANNPIPTSLAVTRTAPAAARVGNDVLVAGGHADGEAAVEWVQSMGAGTALGLTGATSDLDRLVGASGGVLLPSPDGNGVLYVAYDVAGTPSGGSVILRGCGWETCQVDPGPDWLLPRRDVATVITAAGTLWLIGGIDNTGAVSNVTDLVYWDGTEPRIVDGPTLEQPRAGASAIENASGIIVVAGGLGTDAMREDIEMCFPAQLDPLL